MDRDLVKFFLSLIQAKQRCSVLEDQIVDLIIVAMKRSEETADNDGDDGDDDACNTSCLQLWQHLSSQLIFFVLFQFSSFPHMVNALYEKVCVLMFSTTAITTVFIYFQILSLLLLLLSHLKFLCLHPVEKLSAIESVYPVNLVNAVSQKPMN